MNAKTETLREYRVVWEIDLDATSALEAAKAALAVQRDPDSFAEYFTVKDTRAMTEIDIDLTLERE